MNKWYNILLYRTHPFNIFYKLIQYRIVISLFFSDDQLCINIHIKTNKSIVNKIADKLLYFFINITLFIFLT